MRSLSRVSIATLIAATLGASSAAGQPEAADTVFLNGTIYTVNEDQPWATALAIEGTNIVLVGSNIDAEALIGEGTEVVDLGGRMMLPGFYDTQVLLRIGGQMNSVMLNLFEIDGKENVEAAIREHSEALRPHDWVLGTGWKYTDFDGSTKEQLDELTGGRPAILSSESQYAGWYSTKALEYFGIDSQAPEIPGGSIDRNEDGSPSGMIREKAHLAIGFTATPQLFTPEQQETAVNAGVEIMNGVGVIGITEAAARNQGRRRRCLSAGQRQGRTQRPRLHKYGPPQLLPRRRQ